MTLLGMLFNSIPFALFLPVTLLIFWLAPRRFRAPILLIASYFFYGSWDPRFLGLIVASTLTDFVVGHQLFQTEREASRRAWLLVSIGVNLGILGLFKYWGFFVESAATVLSDIGLEPNVPLLSIVLPVGISFYTFQTMSYTIDIYRRQLEPERNLITFATFVAFFPQLVAGPIERAKRLLPQIRNLNSTPKQVEWSLAISLIIRGLFRKIVIADGVAPLVNQVFAAPGKFGSITVLAAVIGFSLQIYGDFAGYTDMARGVAKMFDVDLMENFRAPYLARSFSDFWKRWHISLSTWLRDYLYIPLGGNRHGAKRTYVSLMVTMTLGGLWHGAGWGFVVWGVLHGTMLVIDHATAGLGWRRRSGYLAPAWAIFAIVTLLWIPFRAVSLETTWGVLTALLGSPAGIQLVSAPVVVGVLGFATFAIDRAVLKGKVNPLADVPAFGRGLGYGTAILAAALFASLNPVPFIYFQF